MRATLAVALLLATTACGQARTPAAVTTFGVDRPDPRPARVVLAVAPKPAPAPKPAAAVHSMFRTPQGAMRYLARAWNAHDEVALRHVTTPHVRHELEEMRAIARDLRLTSCKDEGGAYECLFSHAYPHAKGRGETVLVIAPAAKPGWYAAHFAGCG